MTCDEVRAALEAFVTGDLSEREGAAVIDHLGSCPACTLEYEELSDVVGDLRHARGAIRPLRSFEMATLSVARTRRRPGLLLTTSILLGAWAVFSTAAVLWPSLGDKIAFLRIGQQNTHVASSPAPDSGGPTLSLANVPVEVLETALRSLSSASRLMPASTGNLRSAFLPGRGVSVRVTRLGPVVRRSADEVVLRAAISLIKTGGSTSAVQHIQVQATLSERQDGSWTVTRVVTDAQDSLRGPEE